MTNPPTIADAKIHRCAGVIVYCAGVYCSRSKAVSFEALGLPDDTIVLHIGKMRRFRCEKCGSRDVDVRIDWPNPLERRE